MPEFIIRAEETDLFFMFKDYKELIRCKECKYWGANGYRYGCINATPIMMENDYCSNAERKEE